MDILTNKDLRAIIEGFLDLPTLETLLRTKYTCFQKKKDQTKHTKQCLKAKKLQLRRAWHFHDRKPDLTKNQDCLHVFTRNNLTNLERMGFVWSGEMLCWYVKIGSTRCDMVMLGQHPEIGFVHFWRHETQSTGAGQTFLLFKDSDKPNKRYQVSKYLKI